MKWLSLSALVAALAPLAAPVDGLGEVRRGDVYEFTLTRDMTTTDNRGGSGNSHDQDALVARVVEVRPGGVELEYDVPEARGGGARRDWHFPARVFRPVGGPLRLNSAADLEARVDPWLKRQGLTRADCGKLIFTWNAFRIDCDPQSVIEVIARFDLRSDEVRNGALYADPGGIGAAPLRKGASGAMLVAKMAVDADAVRRGRAESDVGAAELMRKPLTLDQALRERAEDTVSGTIAVTFDVAPSREVRRRTRVIKVRIGRPNGLVEDEIVTETLEQRRVRGA